MYSIQLQLEECMNIPFYNSSKFMAFVKMRKDLMCFVISSCLLAGQFPDCWTFFLSSSLLLWSKVHWWIRCSTVWSSLLQGHAWSINLNWWRYALVLLYPVTMSKLDHMIVLLNCIGRCLVQISAMTLSILFRGFPWFPQVSPDKCRNIAPIRSWKVMTFMQ